MRTILVLALLLAFAASCAPTAPGDDDVDAGDDMPDREFTRDCAVTSHYINYADGSRDEIRYWNAAIDPPFDWAKLTVRLCNLEVLGPQPPTCPPSAISCGGSPPPAPLCIIVGQLDVLGAGDGPVRVNCGTTTESRNGAGSITSIGGQRWMHATFRVDN